MMALADASDQRFVPAPHRSSSIPAIPNWLGRTVRCDQFP
ncbi:hypothetical protein SAMN05216486_11623 [bacterium JGI 053]|nr:hypothetical protein SAMN05216486_11623 [bacterium JGI 053]